jgi:hypothetical protein
MLQANAQYVTLYAQFTCSIRQKTFICVSMVQDGLSRTFKDTPGRRQILAKARVSRLRSIQ